LPPVGKVSRANLNRRINAYLKECFSRETPPRVSELAEQLEMKPWELSRHVRKLFGHSLQEWFTRAKIELRKTATPEFALAAESDRVLLRVRNAKYVLCCNSSALGYDAR